MERRVLPGTDLEVSRVCLGTMTFGEQNTEADAHAQLDRAFERGVNFVDTAEMYPIPARAETHAETERIVGRWLARRPREQVVLATKVAGFGRNTDWLRRGEREQCAALDKRDIMLACDASLKRLRTDYIDLYQIHWPARSVPLFGAGAFDPSDDRPVPSVQEQLEAMHRLVGAGKVRHVGVSNETAWGVCQFTRVAEQYGLPRIVTIQNVYNLMSRAFESDLLEACHREAVGLLAYSPLAFGFLTGKYRSGARPPGARITRYGERWPRYAKPLIPEAVQAYEQVARRFGIELTSLALGFVCSRPFVASAIIGATTIAQLDQCLDACQTAVDADMLAAVDAVHVRITNPAP
ncbi:MAG: aldo/keto reductase [Burkholderiales bacterium]|nr:MAG: aldo/keto reductase [Burkholderiales bacterium]